MLAKAGILILLGLLLITGTVSASVADHSSTMVSSKEWVIADNYDFSVITVVAKNYTHAPPLIRNAQVTFTVDNGNYGFFTAPAVTTNNSGVATTSFLTKTKSGTAVITATIISADEYGSHTEVLTLNQKIDHDLPQNAVFDSPAQLPVGTVSDLNITLTDSHGNPIDDKNPAEHHTFNIHMPGGMGRGFWDGWNYLPTVPVKTDAFGNASTKYRISYVSGPINQIYVDVTGNMVSPPETWIEGLPLDEPCYINQVVPTPNYVVADGISNFGLYYNVYDRYMNPMNSTLVNVNASDGTSFSEFTNMYGSVFATFGPKDTAGIYTITATAMDNASAVDGALCLNTGAIGSCSQDLVFHSDEPTDIVVAANPMSISSLDVDPKSHATIQVKVVDAKGNAVVGQNVTFTLGDPTYDYPYTGVTGPSLSPLVAKTGAGTYATSTFTPGKFATSGFDYNATATGSVKVTVTWTNAAGTLTKSQDVTFFWKNYPYLSITVPQEVCKDVKVGDTINVTVSLFGDGAALRPKPIDVVLVTDVSGSMAGTKISDAKKAGKVFAASMSERDRVGLESYGWETKPTWPTPVWRAYAHDDLHLTFINNATRSTVNATIDTYKASGLTPIRAAVYNSTQMIKYDQRSGAVKAIVLMTDGLWNCAGDPKGIPSSEPRMTWGPPDPLSASDSVITYAKNNGITIYTVGLGSDVNTAQLQSYAAETGGKYYAAPTSAQLTAVYQKIAGDLQQTAGGNTQVSLDFGNVKINGVPSGNIADYMEYVTDVHPKPIGPYFTDSTYLNKTNLTPSGKMYFLEDYPKSQDDSGPWSITPHILSFDVGEVKLNDSWSTTFRLNLTQMGQVELFGPDSPSSKICFTDASTNATTCQLIPPLKCNIQQQRINIPFGNKHLSIDHLSATNNGPDPNILTIKWNTTYDGEKVVLETVSYKNPSIPNSHYITVPGGLLYEPPCFEKTSYLTIDTTSWPVNQDYIIRVLGQANDAKNPGPVEVVWHKAGPVGPQYIKLE
jgi:hypothetical protein